MWNNCKDHMVCVAQLLGIVWGALNLYVLVNYQHLILSIVDKVLSYSFVGAFAILALLILNILVLMFLMLGPGWCKDHGCPMAYKGGIFIPRNNGQRK